MSADADRPDDGDRASRRQFFRVFGRQTVSGAGNVLAGVEALRRSSQEALGDLVGGAEDPGRPTTPVDAMAPGTPVAAHGAAAYRSPYRFAGTTIEILEQAELPARATVIDCAAASEVASAIRRGLVSGGPVLGQLAAYTLAAVLARNPTRTEYARQQALVGAADTLRSARPGSRSLTVALERVLARATAAAELDPESVAGAVLDEADRIAAEAATDLARLGRLGAEAMRDAAQAAADAGRLLGVLMHGDQGPLTGGQIGAGVAVLQGLAGAGLPAHAWLTEAAPLQEGRRAAWQLSQLEIAHTLVPDTALGWLLAHRRLDVAMLRAEAVAANGDIVAPLGSLVVARECRQAGIAVVACAPLSTYDPAMVSGSDVPTELRLPAPTPGAGPRIDPALDVVPAELLDALLTDEGPLAAPLAEALPPAAQARSERTAADDGAV
jgi:methylthioribose-1-phosphate isomerase